MTFADHASQFVPGQSVEVLTRVPLDETEPPEFTTGVVTGTAANVEVAFGDGHIGSYRPWFVRPATVAEPGLFDKTGLGA